MSSESIERFNYTFEDGIWAMDQKPEGKWVRYSDHERIVKELEARLKARPVVGPRKLTVPELNHLVELLESRKEEGSYFGPHEQYHARTDRLLEWCKDQRVNEKGEWR